MNKKIKFIETEIEEIDLFKEICKGMFVDDKEIICFDVISNVLHGVIKINELPKETLLTAYAQLKSNAKIWSEIVWFDSKLLEEITPKILKMIKTEIQSK